MHTKTTDEILAEAAKKAEAFEMGNSYYNKADGALYFIDYANSKGKLPPETINQILEVYQQYKKEMNRRHA